MDEVERRAHRNLIAAFARLPVHQAAGFVEQTDEVLVAATGSKVALFNQVLPVADHTSVEAFIAGVRKLEAARLRWLTHLRANVDDHLKDALTDRGYEVRATWPAMVLAPLPDADSPAELSIVRAVGPDDFDGFVTAATHVAEAPRERFTSWLGRGLLDDPDVGLFTGHAADGSPVAISIAICSDDVVGIFNVTTAPAARRRGFGWAMTSAAAAFGRERRCDIATLQSSEMGLPLYEKHGFRVIFDYTLIGSPPPG